MLRTTKSIGECIFVDMRDSTFLLKLAQNEFYTNDCAHILEEQMDLTNHLLTDAQMRQFISDGYLILQADFPKEFHLQMQGKIEEFMNKEGNPGNNFLPRLPETQEVFDHPTIRGALTSVLGQNYIMHPHRHCHYSEPGRTVQRWHKDSYWGYQKIRNHHQWWAMIFYYPQDTVMDMGPSGILPGTQFYAKRADESLEREVHMEGDAGTFALIHYDLWHRGTDNVSQRNRSMMKFQFVRMDAPTEPTWNHQESEWTSPNGSGPPNRHESAWNHTWNWFKGNGGEEVSAANGAVSQAELSLLMNGLESADPTERLESADSIGLLGSGAADAIPALIDLLADNEEPVAVNASYALAAMGNTALPALSDALHSNNLALNRNAGYALSTFGDSAVPDLLAALESDNEQTRGFAAFALGEIGSAAALDKLTDMTTTEPSEWVRRSVVEALGTLEETNDAAVDALSQAVVNDSDEQVRFTTGLSFSRLGPAADGAVPALTQALKDENRYVRANAVDALRRIGTAEATNAAMDYLMASRWCSTTTPESTF